MTQLLNNFLQGICYIAYVDACNRKCMARYFPNGSHGVGTIRIYNFDTLEIVSNIPAREMHANYFYRTHCTNPQLSLELIQPETARENAVSHQSSSSI